MMLVAIYFTYDKNIVALVSVISFAMFDTFTIEKIEINTAMILNCYLKL